MYYRSSCKVAHILNLGNLWRPALYSKAHKNETIQCKIYFKNLMILRNIPSVVIIDPAAKTLFTLFIGCGFMFPPFNMMNLIILMETKNLKRGTHVPDLSCPHFLYQFHSLLFSCACNSFSNFITIYTILNVTVP